MNRNCDYFQITAGPEQFRHTVPVDYKFNSEFESYCLKNNLILRTLVIEQPDDIDLVMLSYIRLSSPDISDSFEEFNFYNRHARKISMVVALKTENPTHQINLKYPIYSVRSEREDVLQRILYLENTVAANTKTLDELYKALNKLR